MIRSERFQKALEGLALSNERIEDMMAAVDWAVARHPEKFPRIPDSTFSVLRTEAYPDAPALRMFFTYSATEVHLLDVEFAENELG